MRMLHKQISRILAEVMGPETPIKTILVTSNFLVKNEVLPKLGPYKQRIDAQLLWRLANDTTRSPQESWDALEKLLRTSGANQRTKMSFSEQRAKQNTARSPEPVTRGSQSSSRPDEGTRNEWVADTEAEEKTPLSGREGAHVK